MRMERTRFSTWELLLLFGPLPALVALAAAIAVEAIPLPTLFAVAIIAYAVLVAGALEAKKDARRSTQATPGASPVLELMNTIPLTAAVATIEVASTRGVCPLGFRSGRGWIVYQDGNLTHPLCRPAVEALTPALQRAAGQDGGSLVSCQCPYADQEVVFSIAMGRQWKRSAQLPRGL